MHNTADLTNIYESTMATLFFFNSTFQKIDFKNVAAFSIFHYLLVQFRKFQKCLIFEFMEIRFDVEKIHFPKDL